MIIEPNCKDCPIGTNPQVKGIGTQAEGTRLLAVRGDEVQFDLVAVGMAPASTEQQRGMPMVGPSGQFFRKTIHQLGLERYYITNCLLCAIPTWASPAEISLAQTCCKARLESEIIAHTPKLILAMGDMPFHQLCDVDYPITEHQGRLFLTHLNIPLVPVMHPAAYLRRPDDAYDFIECTRAGVRYLTNNYHQAGEPTRERVTPDNVDRILAELWKHDVLTVDTETTGFQALGLQPDTILEAGISFDEKHCYIVEPDMLLKFKEVLETKKINGWNLFFDARFLKAAGITPNIFFDGMLAHYCLDERQGSHGLKKVARVYLGADDWEANIKKYLKNPKSDSYAVIPKEERQAYLAKDVCYTHQLYELLDQEVGNNWVLNNVLVPATRVFTETMFDGVPIDPYKLVEMKQLLWQDICQDEREIWDMAGKVFNIMSPVEVSQVIYDDLGVPIDPKFGRSTNKKLFEKLRDEYELVDRIVLHREMNHDLSQYVEGFAKRIDKNFRVHPTIRMFGTVTGRISSEDPSIMNIKRDGRVKEVFVANKGKLLAEFDLKGAELRWYCLYAEDDTLQDILLHGFQGDLGVELTEDQRRDPHFMIGAIAHGVEKAAELRVASKNLVFGRLYLRGIASIERQYGKETTASLIRVMDQLVPNHKKYTQMIKRQLRDQGYVESYFGRKRRYPLITDENRSEAQRQAVNMPIQSASSDLNLLNLIWLYEHRSEFNVKPMFTVHDSIMVEIPDESVIGTVKNALEEHAKSVVGQDLGFTYDVKYGESWGNSKKWKETK